MGESKVNATDNVPGRRPEVTTADKPVATFEPTWTLHCTADTEIQEVDGPAEWPMAVEGENEK
eukprot:164424-Rhodomonas_salina.1